MNHNSKANLIHIKGELSAAAIRKGRKKERLATGEDIQHPFEKFNKIEFQERKEAAVQYCQELIGNTGSRNCLSRKVVHCSCIRDLVTDLKLQLAAEQCRIAYGGRSNDVQREFF